MALVTLTSAKSCGVSTAALALTLAHPRPSLLAECDPSGGSVRYGLLEGRIPEGVGLAELAVADRQDALAEAFEQHLRPLGADGNRQLLAGLTDPRQASAMAGTWERLAQLLMVMDQQAGYDVIVDAGRLALEAGQVHPVLFPAAVLHRSDVVLLVVRATYRAVEQAQPVAAALREELAARGSGTEALGLLVVGQGRYSPTEIATYLQAPVLGLLPWDTAVAGYLSEGGKSPRAFAKSLLLRSAASLADQVEELTQRRRIQRQWGAARVPSPAVAGVVQRLAQARGVALHG
jgi:hypothetical protein